MNGGEIKRRRQAARMTQAELARAVGVSLRTVGNWERGETPPDASLGALERVLGVPTNDSGLTAYDDTELLAELLTRASRRNREERTDEQSATITALPQGGKASGAPDIFQPPVDLNYERQAAYRPDEAPAAERNTGGDDDGA